MHQLMCVDGKAAVMNNISVSGVLVTSRWLPASREVSVNMTLNRREFQLEGIIQWVRRQTAAKSYHEMGILFPNAPGQYIDTLEEIFKSG